MTDCPKCHGLGGYPRCECCQNADSADYLLPCPFCGGEATLEEASPTRDWLMGERRWWGVVCRNTINQGGTCAIEQRPSGSKETAINRWNMRNGKNTTNQIK